MMTIAPARVRFDQPDLWNDARDFHFKSFAQTRNYVGDFCEAATAAASGAQRIKTNGTFDVCPDLKFDDRTFFESKAVGKSGSVIIYDSRFEKDIDWTREHGADLFYWIWRHDLDCQNVATLFDLRRGLGARMRYAMIIAHSTLAEIVAERPKKMLNKQYAGDGARLGYGTRSKGYGFGWSIPTSLIFARPAWTCAISIAVHAISIERLKVFTPDLASMRFLRSAIEAKIISAD